LPSIPSAAAFILILLAIYIGGALALFGLRAASVTEGERFSVVSREGALVVNNVMLSATLGIVLFGTLYPLLAEAMGAKVSVGPPYFNPMSAVFVCRCWSFWRLARCCAGGVMTLSGYANC
jgi:cytochrome c-type biogenesis protein CcmF